MEDLRKIVVESFSTYDELMAAERLDWGFDLSSIAPNKFVEILDILGAHPDDLVVTDTGYGSKKFEWNGDFGQVVTCANPLTGEFRPGDNRPGYCSYVGFSGFAKQVQDAAMMFKLHANYKDETPGERGFV